MGMSTHIIGFAPPDDKWLQMKSIWDSCSEAGIEPPEKVSKFFGWEAPDPAGVEIKLDAIEWRDDMREGYEINIEAIPKQCKIVRFYNAW